jgi:hypothetical protein
MDQTPAEIVLEIAANMEAFAEQGDWEHVEEFAEKLRFAVMQVPARHRRNSLHAAQRAIGHIQAAAAKARHGVTGKLSDIRRGRDAAKAYGSTY